MVSCATQDKHAGLYRMTAEKRSLKELLGHLHNSPSYKEKKSRLLYYLNLGRIHHIHQQYHASNLALIKAKSLMRELYTQSLSKKAQALIVNDQYDIYYGERFERSMVHFYLSLNNFLLWQRGEIRPWPMWSENRLHQMEGRTLSRGERKNALMAARAELLDWDSFLKEWRIQNGNDDMLAKTYGALVHEVVGTRNDLQISLQLYKDALNLLKNRYKDYTSFHDPQEKDNLNSFLKEKILSLTKKIRPHQLKQMARKHDMDQKTLKKVKPNQNVTFILQSGQIPLKKAQKHYYSLEKAMQKPGVPGAVAQIGAVALTLFASKELGLLPPPQDYSPQATYAGLNLAEASIRGIAISFELPKMAPSRSSSRSLSISQNGRELFRKSVPLVNPLGDIASHAIAESSLARHGRVGLRMAGKYLTLIATTYALFQKSENFLARQAALLSFTAGSHLIGKSEKADLRHWNTLPQDIRILNFHLSPGDYEWKLFQNSSERENPISQGLLVVHENKHTILNVQELSPSKRGRTRSTSRPQKSKSFSFRKGISFF